MIYDCFTFFNELDLLEIRLNELNEVIDFFVIVEATYTHQNMPKPLYFNANKDRYKKFLLKIIHVQIDDKPLDFNPERDKKWVLENFQRNCIIRGLTNAKIGDKIIISDVDEIPKASVIKKYANEQKPVVFGQKHYIYFLNGIVIKNANRSNYIKKLILALFSIRYKNKLKRDSYWLGSIMVDFKVLNKPQSWRNHREDIDSSHLIIADAGWHFTYLGGVEKIIEKLNALNLEFDYEPFKDKKKIEIALKQGKSIFERESDNFKIENNKDHLPTYIKSNYEKFENYFSR